MVKATHVHKLRKHRYPSGNSVFFCSLPDCNFKIEAPLSIGKRALCNICNDEFIMNEYTVKLVKPHCEKCGKVKVTNANGETKYVKKAQNKILTDLGDSTANNLRSRLTGVTSTLEDDI